MTTVQHQEPTKRIPIPEEAIDVKLAILVDQNEPGKGWKEISMSGGGLRDTPKSLGIKDGSSIAYTFAGDDDDEMDDDEKTGDEEVNGKFKVVWPSYEDTYEDQMEADQDEDGDGVEGLNEENGDQEDDIDDRKRKRTRYEDEDED